MITVTTVLDKKLGIREYSKYDNRALPALCLKLCGGGLTEKQTVNAMLMRLKVETENLYKKGALTIEMDERPFARW